MIDNFFNFRKLIVLISPLISSFFFIIVDAVPFYLFKDLSFKTQFGFISIYLWICLNPESIRPLFILILGLLIDILNNFFFGFTSFFLCLILFIQKKDPKLLNSLDVKITYIKFSVFIILSNLFSSILAKLYDTNIILNTKNFIFVNLVSLIAFPFIFLVVRYYNQKLKIYVE